MCAAERKDEKAISNAAELRRQAEGRVENLSVIDPEKLSKMEIRSIIHELQVHQVELSIQNEELRQAQLALDSARARYQDLYDFAPVAYLTLNENGTILETNLAASQMFSEPRARLIKKSFAAFVHSADQDIFHKHKRKVNETEKRQVCELRLIRKDSTNFWARLETELARTTEDGSATFRMIVSDISQHKLAEEAAQLAAMVEQRDRFIAMLTHDIKGPLVGCISMLELLLQGSVGKLFSEQFAYIEAIVRSLNGLKMMVRNAVDSYRMDEGVCMVNPGTADIVQIAELCVDTFFASAEIRDITIESQFDSALSPIEADPAAISRIIQNLLDNALKFSPPGSHVVLSCARLDDNVCIRVKDSGPGIRTEDSERVFQRFWQADKSKYAIGSGLGLYITQQLVKAHGGSISCRNAEDRGAVFTVILPVKTAKPVEIEKSPAQNLKILIVDDFSVTRMGLRLMIEHMPGMTVIGEAADGLEACSLAETLLPDIMLMDIGLPRLSGIEACKQIKERRLHPEVIMFTSHEDKEDIFEALAAGARGYCLKDSTASRLHQAINTVASGEVWLDPEIAGLVVKATPVRSRQPKSSNA